MMPHSLFRRFVGLLLAALVLTASVGLTVQRYTCRVSGRSNVAVSLTGQLPVRGCEPQAASAKFVSEDKCCDTSSLLHKLSVPAATEFAAKLLPAPALAVWLSAPNWPVASLGWPEAANGQRWFAASSSPPPLGGRTLLSMVCSLAVYVF